MAYVIRHILKFKNSFKIMLPKVGIMASSFDEHLVSFEDGTYGTKRLYLVHG